MSLLALVAASFFDCGGSSSSSSSDAGITGDGAGGSSPPSSCCPPGSGTLVLFGGGAELPSLQDTWTFDGAKWTQASIASPPPVRDGAGLSTLGSKVVLFGGAGPGTTELGDTWTFDGSSWLALNLNPDFTPCGRGFPSMATLGTRVVMFGGYNPECTVELGSGGYLHDTWTFDGTSWTQVKTPNSPPFREGALIATLGSNIVLFGGTGGTSLMSSSDALDLNDTWTFDGTNWTQVSTAVSPPVRFGATMATLGNKVVLFGGESENIYVDLNDTWVFDGSNWTELTPTSSPPAREAATMSMLGSYVVLSGGVGNYGTGNLGVQLTDTWAFDGTNWGEVNVLGPPSRKYAAMTTLP